MEKAITIAAIFLLFSFSRPIAAATDPPRHNFSAVFAFGDSTFDSGNNNRLPTVVPTVVRADHPPYGRDFPNRVGTGRFSNGRLIPDYIVSNLGLKEFLSPYYNSSSLTTTDLATGVCFASAGMGLDDNTAALNGVDTIGTQLSEFKVYNSKLRGLVGDVSADQIIKNAIYMLSIGPNDMLLNYYNPLSPTRVQYRDVSGFHDFMLRRLEFLIKEIYAIGGRKFTVGGLPPIGCLPLQMSKAGRQSCIDSQNKDSIAYNKKIQPFLKNLQSSLQEAKIAYLDAYSSFMNILQNPSSYGFTEATKGCCGTGLVELASTCNSSTPLCPNPDEFVFWDAVHPSQAVYEKQAKAIIEMVLPQLAN